MKQKIGLAITILVVLTAYLSLKPSLKKEFTENKFSKGEQTMIEKIKKSDKEWRKVLTCHEETRNRKSFYGKV